ncbi:mechanosensitive ion channel [Vibrio lentus]|nr:mechanosensitive ion channel [Vibrio lentus]
MFIGLLIALSQIGIALAPLLTAFASCGVIIGFALQDTRFILAPSDDLDSTPHDG